MLGKIIDLSLTIDPDDRYIQFPRKHLCNCEEPLTTFHVCSTVKQMGFHSTNISMTTQSFTHIDVPFHCFEDGIANDQLPLYRVIGDAVVIDMTHKKPGEGVSARDLEDSGAEVRPGDIAIIRTGWTDQAWGTERFWNDMIYLENDACDWLIRKGIKALAQDFMTDISPMKQSGGKAGAGYNGYAHREFLKRDIVLIEWCTNLRAISKPRVFFVCLPLKLKGTDGSAARVIAIEPE